jgi:hypothetical protein
VRTAVAGQCKDCALGARNEDSFEHLQRSRLLASASAFIVSKSRLGNPVLHGFKERITSLLKKWIMRRTG